MLTMESFANGYLDVPGQSMLVQMFCPEISTIFSITTTWILAECWMFFLGCWHLRLWIMPRWLWFENWVSQWTLKISPISRLKDVCQYGINNTYFGGVQTQKTDQKNGSSTWICILGVGCVSCYSGYFYLHMLHMGPSCISCSWQGEHSYDHSPIKFAADWWEKDDKSHHDAPSYSFLKLP
jgi:hypothetical protein